MIKTPLLSIKNLTSGYGSKVIIRDFSLDIYPGEFCAILGLNGSGKTTILKALCGLLAITNGRVGCSGKDITEINEKKRAEYISYIPQRYSKLIGVTALEAVLMGLNPKLGIFESASSEDIELGRKTLEKLNILNLAYEDFSRLSEGQKQLIILSRALVQNAPVMLMDEPDSSVDFPGKHHILSIIRDLIHQEEKAGLVTLHDPNLALTFCDRLILLHNGQIKSEIDLRVANKDEIHQKLSEIYKNIKLITLDDIYFAKI
jgi:iron complex transport system ATP-binding protein